jgi:basic amino acid/polyamine antiporter, APA family
MWERVPLEAIRQEADNVVNGHGLAREFGPLHLTLLGVGNAIGAGIFVLTGTAAAHYAGPAIALSYVIAGVACLLTSLCYAELSALIPSAGGSFSYARVTLGRFPAWLIGWCMVIEYLIAGATVATGWSAYGQKLLAEFGLSLPRKWSGSPLDIVGNSLSASHRVFDLPAVLMIIVCTWILVRGLRHSGIANAVMVGIKLTVILAVIVGGAFYVTPANWVPFVPAPSSAGHFGWGGVFTGSAIAFFSYSGFEAMSTAARECRNPTRDLPIGLLASLAICVFLYVSIAVVLTGLVPYPDLDTASPVSTALALASPRLGWLITVVNIGTVLGLGAAVLVSLYGQTRTFYSMSVVGYLPSAFARVHASTRTPVFATVCTGAGAAIIAGLLPIELLGELVSMGILIAFSSVCLGVLILRQSRPRTHRPFRAPLYPWVPVAGLASCFGLMISLPLITWLNIGLWLLVGIILFFTVVARSEGRVANPGGGSLAELPSALPPKGDA